MRVVQTYEELGVRFIDADWERGIAGGVEFAADSPAALDTIMRQAKFAFQHGFSE